MTEIDRDENEESREFPLFPHGEEGGKRAPIVAVPAVPRKTRQGRASVAAFCVRHSAAWMLNVSRGVATTCVTGENAADATRCSIDISFFSTVRAPDLGYYSRVGPRNIKAADNYVGLRRRARVRGNDD